MKAFSIRQPWVDSILAGGKVIETRPTNTSFRGRFLIHVSKQLSQEAMDYYKVCTLTTKLGALVAVATLKDVIGYSTPEEFKADEERHKCWWSLEPKEMPIYGYLLENVERLPRPILWKGQLGFFNVPDDVLEGIL